MLNAGFETVASRGLGKELDLNVQLMTILARSLEVIWSGQAGVIIVQAGSERFATLLSQVHNAQYFICSNRKKST